MLSAASLARLSCGGFVPVGLVTAFWTFRKIAASPTAMGSVNVDICHRAALMYSFACLVLAEFAGYAVHGYLAEMAGSATPFDGYAKGLVTS